MRHYKQKGFATLAVVAILAMVGPTMVILMSCTGILASQTNRLKTDAQTENILFSAIEWAKQNTAALEENNSGIVLETGSLGTGNESCRLKVIKTDSQTVEFTVDISWQKGQNTIRHTGTYTINR